MYAHILIHTVQVLELVRFVRRRDPRILRFAEEENQRKAERERKKYENAQRRQEKFNTSACARMYAYMRIYSHTYIDIRIHMCVCVYVCMWDLCLVHA